MTLSSNNNYVSQEVRRDVSVRFIFVSVIIEVAGLRGILRLVPGLDLNRGSRTVREGLRPLRQGVVREVPGMVEKPWLLGKRTSNHAAVCPTLDLQSLHLRQCCWIKETL